MNRLTGALIAYAVLAGLSWLTISDPRIRAFPLLILGLFAVKSILRRNEVLHPDKNEDEEQSRDLVKELKADS
jgi:hypothetical protein